MIDASDGVKISLGDLEIACDSRGGGQADLYFISHAHSDHVAKRTLNSKILCSRETASLLINRFLITPKISDELELPLKLISSGHILGSSALLIEGGQRILYTGDFCLEDRFFLQGFRPPRAELLIIESTYGKPEFVFPKPREVIKEAKDWIECELRKGNSVVAVGYTLGKAQIISKLLEEISYPVYVNEKIAWMNKVYEFLGVKLRNYPVYESTSKPFVLINSPTQDSPPKQMKRVMFTGWALRGSLGYDKAFPLSDHSDFPSLLKTVEKVNPQKVFTFHGFANELASELRRVGYDAISLKDGQRRLLDFFERD
jgi:putative mRNA 3-end processing factor